MTSDDQHFLQLLGNISKDVKKWTEDLADTTESGFDYVGGIIKQKLVSAHVLPTPAQQPPVYARAVHLRKGYFSWLRHWISNHQAVAAAIVAFVGTGSFLLYRKQKAYVRKRRATRADNGARREVVVIAGPPSPISKSLSLDLERRGFIVYMVVTTAEEEQIVQSEGRVDIRPLRLEVVDPLSSQDVIERFNSLFQGPQKAFSGASPHHLSFSGLILVPDLIYPSGPIETISPEFWADALNARVLHTVATAQAFLPTVCESKARVLVLTPSIVSSLRPPFHGVESTVVGALEGFTSSLRVELGTLGIDVCLFKLGNFDFGNFGGRTHLQALHHAKTYEWPASVRALYADNYKTQSRIASSRGLFNETGSVAKGSPLRELHNAVFDALTEKRPSNVWRVGRGSLTYDLAGKWVPSGLVAWMLGIRRVSVGDDASKSQMEASQSWEKV